MSFIDVIRISLQNLSRTKFRSFLTVLGVIIGISAIVLFVSLGVGLQQITANQIASIDSLTTITVTQKQATATTDAGKPIDESVVSQLQSISGVKKISPSVNEPSNVVFDGSSTAALVYGVKQEYQNMEIANITTGGYFQSAKEAVVTTALANALTGDTVGLIGQKVTVTVISGSGTDQQATLNLTITGIDDNDSTSFIYTDLNNLIKSADFASYSALKVKVNDRKDVDSVMKKIEDIGFQVTSIKDLMDQIDKIFLVVQIILGIVSGIGLLVSSLGIINTMTISLLERTREIGIMKAIGAKNSDIRKMFLAESAMIGLFGGAVGVVLAYAFGVLCNIVLNMFVSNSGQYLRLFVTPINFAIAMIGFAVLVSVLSGLYPTKRAQNLPLIVALYQ
jgi:putative ABC transport system permease protein